MLSSPTADRPPVIQLLPALQHGDALSHHALHLARQLVRAGIPTRLYARTVEPALAGLGEPDDRYLPWLRQPHILLYHYALDCDNAALYRASTGRKVLIYHNTTPAHFFREDSDALARAAALGRLTLPALADCDLALAASAYNASELVAAGFDPARVEVLPPSPQLARLDTVRPNTAVLARHRDPAATNLLFVGRVTPSKAQHDLIKVFALYRRHYDPGARLFLVGPCFMPLYAQRIRLLAAALGVADAVILADRVTAGELKAYFTLADVYVCLSRHEGFCAPLAEAMHLGIPIVARPAGAVAETLGGSGLLIEGGYGEVAEAIARVISDAGLCARLVAEQRTAGARFQAEALEDQFATILARVLALGKGASKAAWSDCPA